VPVLSVPNAGPLLPFQRKEAPVLYAVIIAVMMHVVE
jgi:hypothetical protein